MATTLVTGMLEADDMLYHQNLPILNPDIIIKCKQNIVKHNSMILLRCILTLLHVLALVMSPPS